MQDRRLNILCNGPNSVAEHIGHAQEQPVRVLFALPGVVNHPPKGAHGNIAGPDPENPPVGALSGLKYLTDFFRCGRERAARNFLQQDGSSIEQNVDAYTEVLRL